jgi:hypothetical protein
MSDLARAILRAVLDLATRRGLLRAGAAVIPSDRLTGFEDAAEAAIDRLVDAHAQTLAAVHAEALANARADVAHGMDEIARLTGGRDALAAEVTALTRDFLASQAEVDRLTAGLRGLIDLNRRIEIRTRVRYLLDPTPPPDAR